MPTYQKVLWGLVAIPPLELIITAKIALAIIFLAPGAFAGLVLSGATYVGIYLYINYSRVRWTLLTLELLFLGPAYIGFLLQAIL